MNMEGTQGRLTKYTMEGVRKKTTNVAIELVESDSEAMNGVTPGEVIITRSGGNSDAESIEDTKRDTLTEDYYGDSLCDDQETIDEQDIALPKGNTQTDDGSEREIFAQ